MQPTDWQRRQSCSSTDTSSIMDVLQPTSDWALLPEHILTEIFSFLSVTSRYHCSLVCQTWSRGIQSSLVWSQFTFSFNEPVNEKFVLAVSKHGHHMRHVSIELDQSVSCNRINACAVILGLAQLPERRIKTLRVTFLGENPLFYGGQEFVNALLVLFGPPPQHCQMFNQLRDVDLGGLTVPYYDKVFITLANNHRNIERLNIQNKILVCKVTPSCLIHVVQLLRKLRDLCVFNCSLSEDVLLAFTEKDRAPLEHLSIKCRREEKYSKDIGDAAWKAISGYLPDLRVTLIFDHTCPINKVSDVMKPHIPVVELQLETFTYIYDEVGQAAIFYKETLEKLVLHTPISRNSPELNKSMILLAQGCTKLKALHVFCDLNKDTVDTILELHPIMKENKSYTLKS